MRIIEIFQQMDANNDKLVSEQEFVDGIDSLGLGFSEERERLDRAVACDVAELRAAEELDEVGEVPVRRVYRLRRPEVEVRAGDRPALGALARELTLIADELRRQGLEVSEAEALVAQVQERAEEHVPREASEGLDVERRHGQRG